MATLQVKKVVEDIDFRSIHPYRARYSKGLTDGEAVLVFNKAKDKARLFDSAQGMHAYWAKKGKQFDINAVKDLMSSALGLVLVIDGKVGAQTRQHRFKKAA